MDEKVTFPQAFESLYRVLGTPPPAEAVARLKAAGLDPAKPQISTLPSYVAAMEIVMASRWPTLSTEEASLELGRAIMRNYEQTLLGRAVVGMMKVIGPDRAVQRLTRQLRTVNSYTETRCSPLGPGRYEVWINHVVYPRYYCGVFEEGMRLAGTTGGAARVLSREGFQATFELSWSV